MTPELHEDLPHVEAFRRRLENPRTGWRLWLRHWPALGFFPW